MSLAPLMASMVSGAAFSGWMTTRLKHYKRVALVGTTTAAIALFLLSAWADLLPFLGLEAFFVMIGAGIGTSFPLVIVCVENAVRPEHPGVATGATTFLRSLGGAMGVSVLGAVFLSYGFAQSTEAAGGLSNLGPRAGGAFAAIFFTAAIGLVIADVFLLLMEEKPLRRVGKLHQRGLIHKNIKLANILVDSASGAVWLTGFGIASRLPRERQSADEQTNLCAASMPSRGI